MAMKSIRWIPALLLAAALPLAVQAEQKADPVARQVSTASAHAGMALGAADLKMAHAHLQHVINCLVGPSGKGYDAQQADPCKGMGQGAIVDAKGDKATEARLHEALARAEHGTKATTLGDVHADAQKAMASLQEK
jgi:hypothetical protein